MAASARLTVLGAAAAACVLAPALMAVGAHSPFRVAAAATLFALAPGAAALPRLRTDAPLVLVVALSVGISTVAAELMLALHLWSPLVGTCVLAAASLPSIALQLRSSQTAATRARH